MLGRASTFEDGHNPRAAGFLRVAQLASPFGRPLTWLEEGVDPAEVEDNVEMDDEELDR